MKNHLVKFVFLVLLFPLLVSASTKTIATDDNKAPSEKIQTHIRQQLANKFPDFQIDRIHTSPLTDLYEVSAGPFIFYVTKDARYIINGDVFDLSEGRVNLTEKSRKDIRLDQINHLGLSKAISFSPENPKHHIYVFTDLDCAYCRRFHNLVPKINENGIAVHYLAFPRSGIDSPSYKKAVSVWCSEDKNQALTEAKRGKAVPSKTCDNPVKEEFELGVMVGVNGTPTTIFEDGSILPGFLPLDKLIEEVNERS